MVCVRMHAMWCMWCEWCTWCSPATSKSHGMLEAAITNTCGGSAPFFFLPPLLLMPSICTNSSVFMRRDASCSDPSPALAPRMESRGVLCGRYVSVSCVGVRGVYAGHERDIHDTTRHNDTNIQDTRTNLVKENGGRGVVARQLEECAYKLLAVTAPLVEMDSGEVVVAQGRRSGHSRCRRGYGSGVLVL